MTQTSENARERGPKTDPNSPAAPDRNADIVEMPFETALAELEAIVDKLEKGSVSLEDSITLYERGEALKARCDELLRNAEIRIEKITLSADGKPKGLAPLDEK